MLSVLLILLVCLTNAYAETVIVSKYTMAQCALSERDPESFKQCCLSGTSVAPDADTLLHMREQDIAECLTFTNGHPRISAGGTLCVIWDTDDATNAGSASVDAYALAHDGIPYVSFCNGENCPNAQSHSSLVMKTVTGNVHMYIMRWAYYAALDDCSKNGGTLDINPGETHRNAYIYCSIIATPDTLTQQKCTDLQNQWPIGYIQNHTAGDFSVIEKTNGVASRVKCTYTPKNLYYTARDIPGTCMNNMIEDSATGHCMCKYGYTGERGNSICLSQPKK